MGHACKWSFTQLFIDLALYDPEEHQITNYVRKIDKALLAWSSSCDGSWNKAALTTALCKFIEHFCRVRSLEGSTDDMLKLIVPCLAYQSKLPLSKLFPCLTSYIVEVISLKALSMPVY